MRRLVLAAMLWYTAAAAAPTIKTPNFFAERNYPNQGVFVMVADVNGDKIPDVITLVNGSPISITTLLGNGKGALRAGPTTTTNWTNNISPPVGVALDLNGDGITDLVFTGLPLEGPSGIGVCFGNGDGTFQAPVPYAVPDSLESIVAGDFNGDGIPDVALPGGNGIWLLTGKGGGVFNPAVLIPVPNSATNKAPLLAADFNGDGKLDLVVGWAPAGTGGKLLGFAVLFGNGDGTFQTPVVYPTANYPRWMATGDLNGDGHLDIVINTSESIGPSNLSIYLNNGSGGFAAPTQTVLTCYSFAIADVNGDGFPDLVSDEGYISLGLGNATFAPEISYPGVALGVPYSKVVPADLRNQGLIDLVFLSGVDVTVLLNEGGGTFEDGVLTALPNSSSCGAAADFNGDGIPDLAVATSQGVTILFGTGKGNAPFTIGPSFAQSSAGCPVAADLNGDGIQDLLVESLSPGTVTVYLGHGDGTFSMSSVIPFTPNFTLTYNFVVADFNHDGKLDVADSSNQLALGNGDGTFQALVPIYPSLPAPGYMTWIAAGEINNDGYTDLVYVAGNFGTGIYVLLNDQHGGFTLSTIPGIPLSYFVSVVLADLNGDGKLDAIVQMVAGLHGSASDIYLGNGKGGFKLVQSAISYSGVRPTLPQIGDVNGDGVPDLLFLVNAIQILLGKGDGTFLNPGLSFGPAGNQVLLENLHGQPSSAGKPDLVAPGVLGNSVAVLVNLTR